ncbi:MAG: DNA-directed RNA polymerase subunit alpha C-terminal domain-containing protein [Candidatus Uhrbacteria bacterium]
MITWLLGLSTIYISGGIMGNRDYLIARKRNRDYLKNKKARLPLVTDLFALGFTHSEIGSLLGWCQLTIRHDVQSLSGKVAFQSRPTKKKERFSAILKKYAQLTTAESFDKNYGEQDKLFKILNSWLGANFLCNLCNYVQGFLSAHNFINRSCLHNVPESYLRLLSDVLEMPVLVASPKLPDEKAMGLIHKYLNSLASGERPVPTSQSELVVDVLEFSSEMTELEKKPVSTPPDDLSIRVDEILKNLQERERVVIEKYYGLQCTPSTFKQIGQSLCITGSRVQQIKMKALTQLQHPSQLDKLSILVEAPDIGQLINLKEEVDNLRQRLVENQLLIDQLVSAVPVDPEMPMAKEARARIQQNFMEAICVPVDQTFKLSTRLSNCLYNLDVWYLFEVLVLDENEMLKTKNFGKTSLKELKQTLMDYSAQVGLYLHLGMKSELLDKLNQREERRRSEIDAHLRGLS